MEQTSKTFGSFEDLETYKAAREFRKKMYRVAKTLPESEKFNLCSQIRRAALSVTNNIAEGHGRFYDLDNIRFALISRGSVQELMDDLNTCEDEGYLPQLEVARLKDEATGVLRLINGYVRYLRENKVGANLGLHEDPIAYQTDDALTWLNELDPQSLITNH